MFQFVVYCSDIDIQELILRLNITYPGDVGLFAPFFLNSFRLLPDEVAYLGPNLPHAYISGECIEAMSCSDNVYTACFVLPRVSNFLPNSVNRIVFVTFR